MWPARDNRVTVTPGNVLVDSVDVVRSARSFLVLLVNTRTKYPEILGTGGRQIFIHPSQYALHVGEGDTPTTVVLPSRCRGWEVLPEYQGRYSLNIVAWKPGRRSPQEIWRSPVDHYA